MGARPRESRGGTRPIRTADTLGRITLMISEDGGTTWDASPQLFTMRTTFKAGQWRNVHCVREIRALASGLGPKPPNEEQDGEASACE